MGSRRVTLSPEELGVEMLGEKAHTIVMRDDQTPRRSRVIEEVPTEEAASPDLAAELRDSIESSQEKASMEEACQNIEELRPENTLLPRNEFWTLLETLSGGFTKSQLTYYLSTKTTTRSSTSSKSPGPAPVLRETRPWMAHPVVFRPLEELELPSKPGKDRVAFSLMQRAWGLDVWDRVEGLNEIVVSFTDSAWAYLQARRESPTIHEFSVLAKALLLTIHRNRPGGRLRCRYRPRLYPARRVDDGQSYNERTSHRC